jgi:hypothetical protein
MSNNVMHSCVQLARKLGALWLLSLSFNAMAVAGPGNGVGIGSWVFSPYLDLNFTHDSNVYKDRTNEVQDTFFEPELGLRFSSSSETNCFSIRGNLFYSEREYTTEKNRNFKTYGDNVILRYGNGRRSQIELIQSYRLLDDLDRHSADIESSNLAGEMVEDSSTLDIQREINQLGASVMRRMTDKLELGLSYRYSGVTYDNQTHSRLDPKELGVPPGLDLDGHIWQLDGALGLTDKTDAILTLRQGLQVQEGTDGSSDMTTLRLGLRTQGADKLVYTIGGGLERYARPPQIDPDPIVSFNFNAAVDWFITEKLTFRCGGYNGTQFSSFYVGNGLEFISGWAGLGYRWKPSTTFSLRGIYRKDDYLDPVSHLGQTGDRHDKRIEGHARVDYIVPGKFLRLYLEATYDEVDSNFDFVDYVDQRLILGADIRY